MRLIVVAVLLLPILAFAQGSSPASAPTSSIDYYLNLYSSADGNGSPSYSGFLDFVRKAGDKRGSFASDREFIQHLFVKTHQKFLKNFSPLATFRELFENGNYNCLTGTAVYALMLDHFQIDYRVIETNYHIFIVAETDKGEILLETTDPVKGFTNQPTEIQERITNYRKNEIQEVRTDKKYYHYSFDLFNEVKLDQLLGLMHYNIAIANYNNQQLQSAIAHLDKALELYDSPRIEEFSRVILLSVVESSLDTPMKEFYVKKLQSIRKKRFMMMATAKAN